MCRGRGTDACRRDAIQVAYFHRAFRLLTKPEQLKCVSKLFIYSKQCQRITSYQITSLLEAKITVLWRRIKCSVLLAIEYSTCRFNADTFTYTYSLHHLPCSRKQAIFAPLRICPMKVQISQRRNFRQIDNVKRF